MAKLFPLILATLLQQLPATQAPASLLEPYRPGQGVTSPVLVHETKPNYTPAAMRARIQGLVVLECVVMPDGSVGAVRITRSLDSQFGLDQQAVDTLKQWRFRPGMKDGAPVPVLVTVEMSYTLRVRPEDTVSATTAPGTPLPSNRDAPAPLAWPDTFTDASGTVPRSTAFVDGALHQPTFDLAFAYPSTWSRVESSAGITLHAEDESGTRAVMISSPQPAQFSLTEPLSQSALDSFTVAAQAGAAFITRPRVIRSGQVRRNGGLWIWFEMAAQSFAAWNAPAALADRLRDGYGGIHVWSFATTSAGQSIRRHLTNAEEESSRMQGAESR